MLWLLFLAFLLLLSTDQAFGQASELDALAGRVAAETRKSKEKTVFVCRFYEKEGLTPGIGSQISREFTLALQKSLPDVRLASPSTLAGALEMRGLATVWADVTTVARVFAPEAGIGIFISGTVEKVEKGLHVSLEIEDVSNGKKLGEYETVLPERNVDVLEKPVTDPATGVLISGFGGIGFPMCDTCPNPTYTPDALKRRVQGKMFFLVVASAEGRISDIQLLAGLEPSLDRAAVDAVSKWRFKPAKDKTGRAVAVRLVAEISFTLFKNRPGF